MKKYLWAGVVIVVVLVASWICASWYTGKRIEQGATANLAQANAYLTSRFPSLKPALRVQEYHRGFFSSQASYVLESGLDGASVMLDMNIEHGPFPSTLVDRGQFAPAMAFVTTSLAQTESLEPVFQLTGGQSPFVSSTRVSYEGDAKVEWSVPALTYKSEGRALSFSGMKGDGDFTREGRAFIGNLRVELIRLQGAASEDNAALTIEGLSAGLNTRRGTYDLGAGQSHMHAEHIEIKMPDASLTTELDNAGYRVVIEEDGKVVNLELVVGTESLKVSNLNLGALRLVTRARQLDGQAVATITREYDAMSAGLINSGDEASADAAYEQATEKLMQAGKQLLAGGPVFAIEPFLWKSDKGEQRAALSVQLGALSEDGSLRDRVLNTVRQIDGFFNFSRPMAIDIASKVLVDQYKMTAGPAREMATAQIDQFIQTLQDMGVARLEGDRLISRVQYADNVVDLNGEKMPLDAFIAKFDDGDEELAEPDEGSDPDNTDEVAPADMADGVAEAEDTGENADTTLEEGTALGGMDAATVTGILDMLGRTYTVTKDDVDDPLVVVEPDDSGARAIRVEFYDCGPVACENIQLVSHFPAGKVSLKAVNAFNRENRWARVYLDDDNEPTIEMDIDGVGGITQGALTRQIMVYFSMVEAFGESVGAKR